MRIDCLKEHPMTADVVFQTPAPEGTCAAIVDAADLRKTLLVRVVAFALVRIQPKCSGWWVSRSCWDLKTGIIIAHANGRRNVIAFESPRFVNIVTPVALESINTAIWSGYVRLGAERHG